MKPTEDVSQFPENGMNTPETKLTVETTHGAYQPDSLLSFNHANREVLRITHDGHIICGEGLSVNAATQEAAKLLIVSFEKEIQKMVDARIAAELAAAKKDLVIAHDGLDERDRLRDEVENLKTDLFLALRQVNIPAGFWGRAASRYKARAEKAEADTARLDWLEANPEAIRAYSIHKSTFDRKVWWETGFGNYHTAREAIDAGMKEASK